MIRIRLAADRGRGEHGWLDSHHTFSFADYHDDEHVQFRSLRVMNEDRIAPGKGFGTHPHRDMEIVTYVLKGALEHRDSMGNGEVLRPGEFQRMSAGTGITHSEFNPSATEPVHLYQIWLFPERKGIEPGYEQRWFPEGGRLDRWQLVASPDSADGSLRIHQDARISLAKLRPNVEIRHNLAVNRHAWLQVLHGCVSLNGHDLSVGDGAAVSDETRMSVRSARDSEVLLFDLA